MIVGHGSGAPARSSASTLAVSAAARPPTIPGITCRCWPGSLVRSGMATRSAIGICRQALAQVRRRLAGHNDGDRQFVDILTAVAEAGLEAVEAACAEAVSAKLCGRDVVLNILARQRDAAAPHPVDDTGGFGAHDRTGCRLRPL